MVFQTKSPLIIAVIFYPLFYTLFFSPVLLSGKLLAPNDGIIQSLPAFYSPKTLWTDRIFGGFPIAADPQNMTWYPIAMLLSLFGNSWNCFVISAYVLASIFTFGFVYTLTSSRMAGLAAGIILGTSGFFMAHLAHTNLIHSAAWLSGILYFIEKMKLQRQYRFFFAVSGATAMCMLAGHPQTFVYAMGLSILYITITGLNISEKRFNFYLLSFFAFFIGGCLSMIQLLPSFELSRLSVRVHITFQDFISYSMSRKTLILLLFPYIFGNREEFGPGIFSNMGESFYGIIYFGPWNLRELAGYIGLFPLTLAIIGVYVYRKDRKALFWSGAAIISLLLTMGDSTPLAYFPLASLMYHIPVYNLFRVPARHFLEFSLAVAILAGYGIAALENSDDIKRWRYLQYFAGMVSVAVILIFLFLVIFKPEIYPNKILFSILMWKNPALLIPLIIASLNLLFSFLIPRVSYIVKYILIISMIIIDLSSFGWFYEWRYLAPSKADLIYNHKLERYKNILDQTHQRVINIRGNGSDYEEIPPNLSRLWGFSSANGYNPLILSRYSRFMHMGFGGDIDERLLSEDNSALDLMAVRYLVIPRFKAPFFQTDAHWRYIQEIEDTAIYENLRAMPRAWLVPETASLDADKILSVVNTSKWADGRKYDPYAIALIEEPLNFYIENFDRRAKVEIVEQEDSSVELVTRSDTPAFLILSDINYPGWTADIDGKDTHIFQTNYVLRGVMVPPGEHVVRFQYHPKSFYFGAVLSIITGILLIIMLAWSIKKKIY
jgi:hypothetical protein